MNKKRILICNDSEPLMQMTRKSLESKGYVVDAADDGKQCLDNIASFSPDLIILDLHMPKMNGIEILKQLNIRDNPNAPKVMLCSAQDYKSEHLLIQELGASEILIKPIEMNQLLQAVESLLEGGHGVAEASQALPEMNPDTCYQPEISTKNAIRLWGTRGSIPVSNPRCIRMGGNTSCFSFEYNDEIVVIDAGSGIRELGLKLLQGNPKRIHLLMTHTHWDHIQGFPFFVPAYMPGWEIKVYGAPNIGKDLKSILMGQLDRDYFPVQMNDLQAKIEFEVLGKQPLQIGDIKIVWDYVVHPGTAVGYRIAVPECSIGYASDNEYLKGYLGHPNRVPQDIEQVGASTIKLFGGVDLLFHEAQYTCEEYKNKIGWGHTSVSNGCHLANTCGVRRWVLIHHDPMHDDDFLRNKLLTVRYILNEIRCPARTELGYDGWVETI